MHNPIVMIVPADREAANLAMSEIYGFDAGETFRDWRGVAPGGVAPITLLYAAPGLSDEEFAVLEATWAADFPSGFILDATVEACLAAFDAYCQANGLAVVEPE